MSREIVERHVGQSSVGDHQEPLRSLPQARVCPVKESHQEKACRLIVNTLLDTTSDFSNQFPDSLIDRRRGGLEPGHPDPSALHCKRINVPAHVREMENEEIVFKKL